MNTMETICTRKSIRSYTGEPITEEQLQTILKAANAAPVGMGQYDSVHLTVITNPDLLREMDQNCAIMFGKPEIHPLYQAPMLIVISAKMPVDPSMENVTYSNAAIIAQNMALAATELQVGVCHIWGAAMAARNNPEIIQKLQLSEGFLPCCAVTLGHTEYHYEEREIPMDRISKNKIS